MFWPQTDAHALKQFVPVIKVIFHSVTNRVLCRLVVLVLIFSLNHTRTLWSVSQHLLWLVVNQQSVRRRLQCHNV